MRKRVWKPTVAKHSVVWLADRCAQQAGDWRIAGLFSSQG